MNSSQAAADTNDSLPVNVQPIDATPTQAADATGGTQLAGRKRKSTKTKSSVWKEMERVDSETANCKHCGGSFAADTVRNGTSGLKAHLERCPKNPNRKKKGQKSLVFPVPKPGDSGKLICSSTTPYSVIRN